MRGLAYSLLVSLALITLSASWAGSIPQGLQHHSFTDLDSLMVRDQRPVAVFLHAEWCKFCKNMEQTTFSNENVIELLNDQYYFISFDGEQKEDVIFRNHVFRYQPKGRNTGTHELAVALGTVEGELTYPTLAILNPDYEIVFQHNTFLTAKELIRVLEKGYK